MKTAFRFRLRLRRLRSTYDLVKTRLSESEAEAEEPNQSQSVGTCILISLSFRRSRKRSRKKMERFWFFWLRFRRAYDSAYDSDFWFSLGHTRSYDSDSDSVASENQPLENRSLLRGDSKVHSLWLVDFDPFCSLVIVIMIDSSEKRNCLTANCQT